MSNETLNRPNVAWPKGDNLVWDNHGCLPLEVLGPITPHLDRYWNSGVDVVGINIGDSQIPLDRQIRALAHFRAEIKSRSEKFRLIEKTADIDSAKADGCLAVFFDIEGAFAMADQFELVQLYYDLGVRWMSIAYNRANLMGGGVHDETDPGLTKLGKKLVGEMRRVGMITCCSHTGYRTARDVLSCAEGPVIFSHSNARALVDHPRNIPDDLARDCAATGGVIGINGLEIFLGVGTDLVQSFVRHIDHFVQLLGPAHIGLGLDYVFDQEEMNALLAASKGTWPEGFGYRPGIGFMAPEAIGEVMASLERMGYRPEDLKAIMGGNFRRIAEAVWH